MKHLVTFIIGITVLMLISTLLNKCKVTFDRDDTGKKYMVEAYAVHVNEKGQTVIHVSQPIIDEIVVPVPANDFRDYVYDVVMGKDERLHYVGVRRHDHP